MSDEERIRERGPWIGCVAVVLVLGLPCYVFSVGPFVWLVDHGYLWDEVGVVYLPLGFLCEQVPIVDAFFDWYLAFWR